VSAERILSTTDFSAEGRERLVFDQRATEVHSCKLRPPIVDPWSSFATSPFVFFSD